MSPAGARAKYMRGALVGLCAAVTSAAAHGAAGGGFPPGGSLILVALACSMAGGLAGTVGTQCGGAHRAVLLGWLLSGQLLGHLALLAAGCYGHEGSVASPTMLGAHLVGALVCTVLIAAAEHLYMVCMSVLSWLIVFFAHRLEPALALRPLWVNPPVLQSVLLTCGGGTRGPPRTAGVIS